MTNNPRKNGVSYSPELLDLRAVGFLNVDAKYNLAV